MAYHMERLLLFGGEVLPVLGRQFGLDLEAFGANGAPWAIITLQIILVFIGGLAASAVIRRIYMSTFKKTSGEFPVTWRLPAILTTFCYIWLFIAS